MIKSNSIEIYDSWVRQGKKGTNSAAYLSVFNGTPSTDTLFSVQTDIAGKAEFHESYEEDDMTGMRPAGPLIIVPDSVLQLKPGRYHIMLVQLTQPLSAGDSIQISLEFSNAGKIQINAPIKVSN